jgi:hypothetical protein
MCPSPEHGGPCSPGRWYTGKLWNDVDKPEPDVGKLWNDAGKPEPDAGKLWNDVGKPEPDVGCGQRYVFVGLSCNIASAVPRSGLQQDAPKVFQENALRAMQ